jgi:nitrogen PTS system EIIA component
MPIAQFLAADRIGLLVEADGRDAVLDAAARLLGGSSAASTSAIADSLRQRERMGSTAIGHGVAVPHGRSSAFSDTRAAFLRLQPAVEFGAGDGIPVDLVFAMAAPEHFSQQHLQLLSEVAERFADPEFRATLRRAADVDALRAALLAPAPLPAG